MTKRRLTSTTAMDGSARTTLTWAVAATAASTLLMGTLYELWRRHKQRIKELEAQVEKWKSLRTEER